MCFKGGAYTSVVCVFRAGLTRTLCVFSGRGLHESCVFSGRGLHEQCVFRAGLTRAMCVFVFRTEVLGLPSVCGGLLVFNGGCDQTGCPKE